MFCSVSNFCRLEIPIFQTQLILVGTNFYGKFKCNKNKNLVNRYKVFLNSIPIHYITKYH